VLHPERLQVISDRQPRLARADHHHIDLFCYAVGAHRSSCCLVLGGHVSILRGRRTENPRQVASFWLKNDWRWLAWHPPPSGLAGRIKDQQT
jgi:hypothetical protein